MKLLAFSDIHSPKYLTKLKHVLDRHKGTVSNIDLVLIAGDLTKKGSIQGLTELVNVLREYLDSKPIVACPGNEDFENIVDKIRRERILTLLDDEELELEIRGQKVRIYGTRGVLDEPTAWQKRNIKNIREVYEKRLQRLRELLRSWSNNKETLHILLSHYAVTYLTLEGEDRRIWRQLGTCRLDSSLGRPMLVIHGHAHRSTRRAVKVRDTLILNVAFPGVEGVFLVDVSLPDKLNIMLLRANEVVEIRPAIATTGTSIKTEKEGSILDFLR